jgi:hypothetical protein
MTDPNEKPLHKKILEAQLKRALAEQAAAECQKTAAEVALMKARIEAEDHLRGREYATKLEAERFRLHLQNGRPSRFLATYVFYDDEKQLWACAYDDIVTYGDSPEMACDNFDHLWVYG